MGGIIEHTRGRTVKQGGRRKAQDLLKIRVGSRTAQRIARQPLYQRICDGLASYTRQNATAAAALIAHTASRLLVGTTRGMERTQITGNATTRRRRNSSSVVFGGKRHATAGILEGANPTARLFGTALDLRRKDILVLFQSFASLYRPKDATAQHIGNRASPTHLSLLMNCTVRENGQLHTPSL